MKVSVIVPIYNGANILQVTIPKLINQDYPKEKTEIIHKKIITSTII